MATNFSNNNYRSNNIGPGGQPFINNVEDEKKRLADGYIAVVEELKARWNKDYANAQIFPTAIASIHPEVRDFLLSFSLVSVYDNIAKQASLDVKGRNALPQVVWKIAQEKNWNNLDQVLESYLPLEHSLQIIVAELLQKNIISKAKMLAEKPVARNIVQEKNIEKKLLQISLAEAIEKYSEIQQQSITTNQIKLRNSSLPVRPSIKNWITDFHASMGASKHSPIDRGNFLFHGENGKNLTSTERQKVGMILKSLDEKSLLTIDPVAQAVVFEGSQQSTVDKINIEVPRENIENNQNFHFNVSEDEISTITAPVEDFVARFQQKNFGQQTQVKRTTLPDINLRPTQQDVVPTSGKVLNTPINSNIKTQSIAPINQSALQQQVEKNTQAIKKEEKIDNFFQLPKSKPPIGSEDFHVAIAPVIKTNLIAEKPLISKNPIPEKTILKQEMPTDPNMMSDELLYKMIQEKKIKQLPKSNNGYNMDTIIFSSAQQLPAEKDTKNIQNLAQQSSQINQKNIVDLKH